LGPAFARASGNSWRASPVEGWRGGGGWCLERWVWAHCGDDFGSLILSAYLLDFSRLRGAASATESGPLPSVAQRPALSSPPSLRRGTRPSCATTPATQTRAGSTLG